MISDNEYIDRMEEGINSLGELEKFVCDELEHYRGLKPGSNWDYKNEIHLCELFLDRIIDFKESMAETASKDRELLVELSMPDFTDQELEDLLNEDGFPDNHVFGEIAIKVRKHLEENPL